MCKLWIAISIIVDDVNEGTYPNKQTSQTFQWAKSLKKQLYECNFDNMALYF